MAAHFRGGIVLLSLVLAACGETRTGVFADSRVEGLDYITEGLHGLTSATGEFRYEEDALISFAVGGIGLGTVPGDSIITPFTLVPGGTLDSPGVINRSRLLLTLDADGDSSNGIQITATQRALAAGVSLDFSQAYGSPSASPADPFGIEGGPADNYIEAALDNPAANLVEVSRAQGRA